MHWLARRALRTQAAVRRLVVEGKALGPWTKTLRVVFLVTILFSVIATFVETVEPFTTGLAEIEARDPAAFDSVKPKEFPDPGSWGCARSFATLGDLFTRSGPIMVFVAFCELAYLAVFAAELALTLWASRLEVHDTRHTPRLKRAHIQAAAIQRACGCVQARWWCASLAVRFFGSCGAWMAERTCLPFTLDSIAGMALQAAASRRADVILRKVTRSRSRGGAAEPDPVTQTPLAPGSPTKRSARAKSVMRTRTAAPSSFMAPAGGTSGPSPLPNPMLAASSAANPLTARAGEAMLPVDPGGTPAGRVVRAPLAPSVTSSQAQLMLAAHAAANGGVVRASPADMSVRPASLPSWPRVRPVCCCLCADVPVPDPGTASCFLGQHVVHGRAHLWKPGSDVLTLTAARKRRERAIAEGRLGEDGGPADDAAPAFLGGGLDGEDGPGTPRFRRESGRSQGRAEAGTPRLNGSPTNWSDGDGAPSRRSSGSTTGFGSILTQLAAAGGSTRRVVSASALNRSRISEGVLRFGEVFGDDAVATMAFADGIVSPRAPQAAAAAVLAGFGGARPQADLRATGVAGVGAVPRRRTLPPRQGRDSQRDDLHSDAASRSRSRSDAPAVSPGGANAVSSSSSSSPSAKEQELAASRAAPMSPIPEGSVGGETEASSHAGTSRRSLRARGSDREMHTEGSDGKSDAKAVAGPRHVSPLASLGGAGQGDGLSGSGGGRPAAVDDDPAILAPVEQAWCTACLPRWLCAQACRAFARPSPQSAARAPFSPVADLIAAGSEAAVNWTLFSDRPSLRVAVPIVGGELAPLPIRSVVGADAAGLEPLSSSGSFVMRGLNLAAPASAAGAAVAYSSASSGSSTSAAGAAGGQRKSIGASAMLAVSAAEIELPRTRARSGSSPVTMGAGWRRPLPQAARPGRAGRRLDSLAIEIRNRAQQGRRSRVASGTDGSFGSGEGGDDDGSATGTANETEAAASASASAPGRTVMALGRSFTLHPSSAGAEAAGASVQGDPPSASMHTVDIAPEFLDVIPADWLWSRVWAFSRLERLLDAVFLVPGIVWLASGLDPTVVGPCVLGMNAWRVLRATRVVKVLRYFGRFSLLTEAFSRKIDALATSWLLCACGAVILAGLIFVAEFEASSEFNEMGSAFWWSIITLTTVSRPDVRARMPCRGVHPASTESLRRERPAASYTLIVPVMVPRATSNSNTTFPPSPPPHPTAGWVRRQVPAAARRQVHRHRRRPRRHRALHAALLRPRGRLQRVPAGAGAGHPDGGVQAGGGGAAPQDAAAVPPAAGQGGPRAP